jgi:hypothetical protein
MVLRTIEFSSVLVKGLIFSLAPGTYEVLVGDSNGHLCTKDSDAFEVFDDQESFFDEVTVCNPVAELTVAGKIGIAILCVLLAGGIAATVVCVCRRKGSRDVETAPRKQERDHIIDSESANPPSYTGPDP